MRSYASIANVASFRVGSDLSAHVYVGEREVISRLQLFVDGRKVLQSKKILQFDYHDLEVSMCARVRALHQESLRVGSNGSS